MAPGCVSPPLRYGSTCPLVGVADASETSASGARSARPLRTSHPRRWRTSGPHVEADASPPENAPLGAFSGAPVDARAVASHGTDIAEGRNADRLRRDRPSSSDTGAGRNHFRNAIENDFLGRQPIGPAACKCSRGAVWPARGSARQRRTDTCTCTYLHPCKYASPERKAQAAKNFVGFQRRRARAGGKGG